MSPASRATLKRTMLRIWASLLPLASLGALLLGPNPLLASQAATARAPSAAALLGQTPSDQTPGQTPSGQTPGGQTPARSIIAHLRDPSGAPIAGASGWLRTEPAWRIAALPAGVPPPLQAGTLATHELTGRSDDRGLLRFAMPDDAQACAGAGMVTTEAGLGALLPRMQAKRLQAIKLQPLAQVTTATGSESFVMVARATLPDGSTITLPPFAGSAVRMPAGN